MAIHYYDEAITQKIKNWLADSSKLRVLSPDETNRLMQLNAEDSADKPLTLPLIAISRNKDIELLSAIKQNKSFDGLIIKSDDKTETTIHMNVIPIKTTYQIDIYTKKRVDADEYVRQYLFKLINNPKIVIGVTYNNYKIKHTANLRVLNTISDTSDISTHIYPGQFYKWTIQLELHDGFLFSLPQKQGWKIPIVEIKPSLGDDNIHSSDSSQNKLPDSFDDSNSSNESDTDSSYTDESESDSDWEEILFEYELK